MNMRRHLWLAFACAHLVAAIPSTHALPVLYWDPEGITATTVAPGTWSSTNAVWSTNSSQSPSPVIWTQGDSACFCAGTTVTGTFNVTINGTQSVAGIFNGTLGPPSCNVTLSGPGSINLMNGLNSFSAGAGASTTISVPITGPGTLVFQGTGEHFLSASNSYSGGTSFGLYGNDFTGLVIISNIVSLGTGPISVVSSGFTVEGLTSHFDNAWSVSNPANINFIAPRGLSLNGPWNLGAATVGITAGPSSTALGIAGIISGSGGITKDGSGSLLLSATNSYKGATTISNGVLGLNITGSINNSSALRILPGAIFDVTRIANFVFPSNMPLVVGGINRFSFVSYSSISSGGTVNFANNPLILSFIPTSFIGDIAHPCLHVDSTQLIFNGNTLIVTNAASAPLGPGTYQLIAASFGSINGTISPTLNVYGNGIASNCIVTAIATSNSVNLVVTPKVSLSCPVFGSDAVELLATAPSSQTYIVQTTSDLTEPVTWTSVATNSVTTNGLIDFFDTNRAVATNLFYRLQFP